MSAREGYQGAKMSRLSTDQMKDGKVLNGFDYDVQAWVRDSVYQDCGHPAEMKARRCCNAHLFAGQRVGVVSLRYDGRYTDLPGKPRQWTILSHFLDQDGADRFRSSFSLEGLKEIGAVR